MEKLELKHLCGYLPWGIEFTATYEKKEFTGILDARRLAYWIENKDKNNLQVKLHLLPLSALTETLEDGSVPAMELIKIQVHRNDPAYSLREVYDVEFENNVDWSCGLDHYILPCLWWKMNGYGYEIVLGEMCPMWVSEYLYSKHFDIHNRIPAGLAIDKRTVK